MTDAALAEMGPIARGARDVAAGYAGQSTLAWLKFREHRLALLSAVFIGIVYVVAIFAEFLAPSVPEAYDPNYTLVQPQGIHLCHTDSNGWHFEPHVTGFMKRAGKPEEVAGAVLWLLSDEASYTTAATIMVSGGL